jgi:membrane-associated phospholipid phosphatase
VEGDARARLERRDWYRLLRVMGYLPTWIAISALIVLGPWAGAGFGVKVRERAVAWLPAVSAGLAGATAEVLKLIVGRERPHWPDGGYRFRSFLHGFVDGSNLGMPSSHAAVAFGGAFMLARLYPRLWPVALAGAVGCGMTRMWMGAHFATDVYVAAGLGYAIAWLLAPGREGADGPGMHGADIRGAGKADL